MMSSPNPLAPAIVLVDDEFYVRAVLPRILEDIAEGYELLAVEDGQAVLATLTARSVPLLLTDYHMPGMNGIELAHAVKVISPATRVVLLTADPSAAQKAVGVDYILTKPFALAELRQIVRTALDVNESTQPPLTT
jgi:putative two-component system response regulator